MDFIILLVCEAKNLLLFAHGEKLLDFCKC